MRAILSHRLVNYIYNNFERVEMKLSNEQKPWRNVDDRHQFMTYAENLACDLDVISY